MEPLVQFQIILIAVTLLFISTVRRLQNYLFALSIQGFLLFGIAMYQLKHIEPWNLMFILTETLVFKGIIAPWFIGRILRRNNLRNDSDVHSHHFFAMFATIAIFIFSFLLSYSMHDEHLQVPYFTVSLTAIFSGIFVIVYRRKLISHVIGYMVLENGIFLLSLAVGSEMPIVVNTAILLDIFTSTILLGLFVNRISETFKGIDIENLNKLRD